MPIQIVEGPEPLSEASYRDDVQLIESDALNLLTHELRRYCRQEVSGRSFLISGHRGAGKTTLASHAFLRVWNEARSDTGLLQPLFIPLHGPNLLPPRDAPLRDETAGNVDEPAAASSSAASAETTIALEQITLGLHRALVTTLSQAYRKRTLLRHGSKYDDSVVPIEDGLELAAQLELELFESPTPARLRELWRSGGFLRTGVLFPEPRPGQPRSMAGGRHVPLDQGLRELVALAGVCEAYRRISGKYRIEDKSSDAASLKSETTLGAETGKEFFAPLVALLSGGLVGVGLRGTGADAYAATIAGILGALGTAMVMKYSSTRTRNRSATRDYAFVFNTEVATLDRVIPILTDRLRLAGLAPVFVVDELDKVENLSHRIVGMVHHLKKFVAESAFFVFITDRKYFEDLRQQRTGPYPVEHTYFGHQLFIAFRPPDLHRYVRTIIQDPGSMRAESLSVRSVRAQEEADYPFLPYIVLHRAQMHPIDLRRQIAKLRDDNGYVRLRPGVIRTRREYLFDVRIQVTIEIVLEDEDFRSALEMEPEFGRLAHDAMYYLSRCWHDDPDAEISLDDADTVCFGNYLVERMGRDGARSATSARQPATATSTTTASNGGERISAGDCAFLFDRVRDVARLLGNDALFRARFVKWNEARKEEERVPQAVIDALLSNAFSLLIPGCIENRYWWACHPSGRLRASPLRQSAPTVRERGDMDILIKFIEHFEQALVEVLQ